MTQDLSALSAYAQDALSRFGAPATKALPPQKPLPPSDFNAQERQIFDAVDLSEEALAQLEELRRLNDKLESFLDRLQGREPEERSRTLPPGQFIAGRETYLEANISIASYVEETLEVEASFNDNGQLEELTITKTEISVTAIQADFLYEDTQFYAYRG